MNKPSKIPLYIALSIPIILIIIVAVALYVPAIFSHPKVSFLYSNSYIGNFDKYGSFYIVQGGKLVLEQNTYPVNYDPAFKKNEDLRFKNIQFFVYDPTTDSSAQISPDQAIKLNLSTDASSPDGYSVSRGRGNSGIFELFGGTNDYNSIYMQKGAVSKKININISNNTTPYSFSEFYFVGWILK